MRTMRLISNANIFLHKCNNSFRVRRFSLPPPSKEKKIQVGNWNINYLKVGSGPHNILCMPGALGSIWSDFKPQIEGLDKKKYTIVVWDPPGYGDSRPPEREFPTDFYKKDAKAAQQLMEALKLPKYSLLGWSDGGITGLILAAKYPQNVNKLVVWGTNSFILPTELEMYQKMKDVSKWSSKMRQPMVNIYGEQYFPLLWEKWINGMCNLYKTNNGDICTAVLGKIKCPTLIIHGEKDPMVDNSHVSHLQANISNSSVHLYPDGKHNVHLRYAEDFNKRLQIFLEA